MEHAIVSKCMIMIYRISEEHLSELKSRLRIKALQNFFRQETVIWSVIVIISYLMITTNLTFLGSAYLFVLIIGLLRGQLWISHDAKVLVNHFSVELTDNLITYRQGFFARTLKLQETNYEINKSVELIIKSKNRRTIDILLQRRIFHIPPETHKFQEILNELKTVANNS